MSSRPQQAGPQPPNAHYIFPSNRRFEKCAVLISGDEDQFTGRDKILSVSRSASGLTKHTNGDGHSVFSAESVPRMRQSTSPVGIELIDVPPSWHRSAPMLEYHVKYGHGFMFVFSMSSRGTLELVREMCDAVMHTASALALNVGGDGSRSTHIVLVGNVDKALARREDCSNQESARSEVQGQTNTSSVRMEAEKLAERWGCELFEVDTGSGGALSGGANHAFSSLLRKIEETSRNQGSGLVYGFSETKPPQRLLIRRTVGRILPDALVKLFAK